MSAIIAAVLAFVLPGIAHAHCDSLDGPVITEARAALASGDVTPLLKWVTPEQEGEVKDVFEHVMKVRDLGDDAQRLADRFLFETLVRLHRASEGAPYTGLKRADSEEYQVESAADGALASGSVEDLAAKIGESAAAGVRERYARAQAARSHADESVAAGRAYVASYVDYVHYVLSIHNAVAATEVHHHGSRVEAPAVVEAARDH
jgi:hypothetical protein